MLDPILGVKTDTIKWFNNGVWKAMPHRHFFVNCLRQHFRQSGRHMPTKQQNMWADVYKTRLMKQQTLRINNLLFKVEVGNETANL